MPDGRLRHVHVVMGAMVDTGNTSTGEDFGGSTLTAGGGGLIVCIGVEAEGVGDHSVEGAVS